jgi:hypothetical protein
MTAKCRAVKARWFFRAREIFRSGVTERGGEFE